MLGLTRLFAMVLVVMVASPSLQSAPKKNPSSPVLLEDWLIELRLDTRSLSVGRANSGEVVRSDRLPLKGNTWRTLPAIKQRRTNYGTEALVATVIQASQAVAVKFPGSRLEIGNLGSRDGGKIRQSMSHQSGRDVDLAFFYRDPKGKARMARDFKTLDSAGKTSDGWTLDVPRTWALVRFLVTRQDHAVQWVFLFKPLKKMLLEYAQRQGEDREILDRAAEILHQPSDSNPHDDHMHIRIHCSQWDLLAGCEEYGPTRSLRTVDDGLLREVISHWENEVQTGDKKRSLKALERLQRVSLPVAHEALARLVCHPDEGIAQKVLEAIERWVEPGQFVADALEAYRCTPSMPFKARIMDALASYRDRRVWKHSLSLLNGPSCMADRTFESQDRISRSLCLSALEALGFSGRFQYANRLADYLDASDGSVRKQALHSIQRLFARKMPALRKMNRKRLSRMSEPEKWEEHVNQWKRSRWEEAVRDALTDDGFKLSRKLLETKNIPELYRAVRRGFPVSYSAQVALSRILQARFEAVLDQSKAISYWHRLLRHR